MRKSVFIQAQIFFQVDIRLIIGPNTKLLDA